MDLLMNGGVYIKRGPETIVYDVEQHKKNKEHTEKLRNEMFNDPNTPNDFLAAMFTLSNMEKILDDALGKQTYGGCDSFWILLIGDKGIEMNEREVSIEEPGPETTSKRFFDSKEEMDKRFISLDTFLDEAEFVGKKFKKPAKLRIDMYTKRILLYKTDTIWLTYEKNKHLGTEGFFIHSKRPGVENLNYKTYGRTHKEFDNKSDIHFSVLNQLTRGHLGLTLKK